MKKEIALNNDMTFIVEFTEEGAKLQLIENSDKEIVCENEISDDDLFQLLKIGLDKDFDVYRDEECALEEYAEI